MQQVTLPVPREFSFERCFQFLKRSPHELLHRVEEDSVVKLLLVNDELILISVKGEENVLKVEFLDGKQSELVREHAKQYVREWFDLETDLKPFYALARKDDLLRPLIKKFYGYRIVGQPDLFESLIWAVLGQQINLQFAYTLKGRFVAQFGDQLIYKEKPYYLFPTAVTVSQLNPEPLLSLQFSRQKASYTIGIAEAFAEGRVSKDKIATLPFAEAKEELMKIKGIGNWTANYALMKTFRYPNAFPLEDAGLHNAIKNQLGLKSKPDLNRVKRIFKKYKGWEAYATLYLWKSL